MNHKDLRRLSLAIEQYLLQRIKQGFPDAHVGMQGKILQDFQLFVERQPKAWDEIFTLEILKEFIQEGNSNERRRAVRGLANFLYREKQISQPIPRKSKPKLPAIFEDYLFTAPRPATIRKKRYSISGGFLRRSSAISSTIISAFLP